MPDAFDFIDEVDIEVSPPRSQGVAQRSQDPFDVIMPFEKESKIKSFLRTVMQVPSGIARRFTFPLDLLQMMGTGAALDPEEIDQIRKISEREGIPFDEERYLEAVQNAAASFPTQAGVEQLIEAKTGLPLEARTPFQKGLELASTAAAFTPPSITQRGAAAIAAPAVSTGLEAVGVPEPLAEAAGLGVSGLAAGVTPAASITRAQVRKPSGLPVRKFEAVKEPRRVSEAKLEKINIALESDFREIGDKLLEQSVVGPTREKLGRSSVYKTEVGQQFQKVENLSKELKEIIPSKTVVDGLKRRGKAIEGLTPSEYEKDFISQIKSFSKNVPKKDITPEQIVKQYRKNNRSLGELYEPGKSYAANRAKKDSLLEYNRYLSELIETKYPKTEFSKLFKETNEKWTAISDVEAIDKFIDSMFEGNIQFKNAQKFFDNPNIMRPFERSLGDQFPKFKSLMKDLMESEKAHKMLQVAKKSGFEELSNTAGTYIISRRLGKARTAAKFAKSGYKAFMNAALEKPELVRELDIGVQALKKGNFDVAAASFSRLDKEVEEL